MATDWLWRLDDPHMTTTEGYVLWVLCESHNATTGRCDPSVSTIAAKAHMSQRAAFKALASLRERGLVDWDGGRTGTANRYRLPLVGYAPRADPGMHHVQTHDVDSSPRCAPRADPGMHVVQPRCAPRADPGMHVVQPNQEVEPGMNQVQSQERGAPQAATLDDEPTILDEPETILAVVVDEPAPAKAPRGTRGTRLPDDWQPSEELLAWARTNTPGAGWNDHEAFADYWHAVPGAKGCKLDWDATWRNWMRKASTDASRRRPGQPTGDALRAQWAVVADKFGHLTHEQLSDVVFAVPTRTPAYPAPDTLALEAR